MLNLIDDLGDGYVISESERVAATRIVIDKVPLIVFGQENI